MSTCNDRNVMGWNWFGGVDLGRATRDGGRKKGREDLQFGKKKGR